MTKTFLLRFFAEEIRAWNGQAPLARVFWLYGVLRSLLLILLYATTLILEQRRAEQAMLIFCAIYTAWILVAIWRCADQSESPWAAIARLLTVAWAANAAMVLMFRQLDIFGHIF